ncbi:helix-turn-helix domain-containing protein [Lelliottia sp. SL45]|uniref:helix-turn-helix domain-containing protein n=1 Tax=Lelliottia sp. SL45 TaxID=2994665 RepID=UPI0022738C6D|nr:helix-turn-helix domain-containing protein [Lelliottia sp. SL45]MCY1700978.1 helix-turn-helix domain-containing protein [Lelliottia sp. SL45]
MDKYMDLNLDGNFIEQLSVCKDSHTVYAAGNQKILFDDKKDMFVYIIQSGTVNVRRKHDDIIVLTVKGPSVLGLTSLFSGIYYHYLSTVTECQIIALNRKSLLNHIEQSNLWRETSKVLCQAAQFYYRRDEAVSGSTVYEVIKSHLEILWYYPPEDRQKISVFDFVMGRSSISRSSLNKVLKDLSVGGYIIMQRGKLVEMKKLPQHY